MSQTTFESGVVSMRCRVAKPGDSFEWHCHPFDEFTLITDDEAVIGHGGEKQKVYPNTLCFYHRGIQHGGWCLQKQRPKIWVVHFSLGEKLPLPLFQPAKADARARIWNLSSDQAETFKWLYLRLLNERINARKYCGFAESCWLPLLLISVQRWADGETAISPALTGIKSEVVQLWHLVNSSVGRPDEFARQIYRLPNYDSVRHSFTKVFGVSPRQLMGRLRMQQAKNLLLETTLRVNEIASRIGYSRQHEFARAFNQQFGCSPSQWRTDPIHKSFTTPAQDPLATKPEAGNPSLRMAKNHRRPHTASR